MYKYIINKNIFFNYFFRLDIKYMVNIFKVIYHDCYYKINYRNLIYRN